MTVEDNSRSTHSISIAFAGSSANSLTILQGIANHSDLHVIQVITPIPKKIGRQQLLTKNPVQLWAEDHNVPLLLVDQTVDTPLAQSEPPDYLLVVDFGYKLPRSLLSWPKIAPLNLHPSALPAWRGSSPGQMVILSGEKQSAISLIRLTLKLDSGPIIIQQPFAVNSSWSAQDYYQHTFQIASAQLPLWIKSHYLKKIAEKPQPAQSPTLLARKIAKEDAFVPWSLLKNLTINKLQPSLAMSKNEIENIAKSQIDQLQANSLLLSRLKNSPPITWPQVIERAVRAFYPWPILWTLIPTKRGKKRMQVHKSHLILNTNTQQLALDQVKIEGQQLEQWSNVKNIVQEDQK